MTRNDETDISFPYVLICSILGTVISLSAVWITTDVAYAPGVVA
jgi:hypothetical protein